MIRLARHFPIIRRIEKDTRDDGFHEAIVRLMHRSGTKLHISGRNPLTNKILQDKAVVVIGNHPYKAEVPAVIAALPQREDIFLIITASYYKVSPHFDRFFIPVYIQHHFRNEPIITIRKVIFRMFYPFFSMNYKEAHAKNIESISNATEKLNEGALVVIFPERGSVTGKWFSGVGHMLVNADKNTYIVNAYITGTSSFDLFRAIPGLGKFFGQITVNFSHPIKLLDVFDADPKILTKKLENRYEKWKDNTLN